MLLKSHWFKNRLQPQAKGGAEEEVVDAAEAADRGSWNPIFWVARVEAKISRNVRNNKSIIKLAKILC